MPVRGIWAGAMLNFAITEFSEVGLPLYGVLRSAPCEEIAAWHSSRPAPGFRINGHVAYRLELSKLVR
jgi:hypothetical protein